MNTNKLSGGRCMTAVVAVLLFANHASSQPTGPPPMRSIQGRPDAGPPPTRAIEGQPRSIEGQPGGDSDEPPLPQQQRQVGPRMESGGPGVESRSAGRGGGSRETIRVSPRPRIIPQGRWQLGIYFDDSPRGLRIRQVIRPSAASRIGLEEGDYLLDIMGYPVGFYGSSYYTLEGVLNRLAPQDGWVNILVWNKRTLAEEAMWVQLDRRGPVVPTPRPRENAR